MIHVNFCLFSHKFSACIFSCVTINTSTIYIQGPPLLIHASVISFDSFVNIGDAS